jgi:hypothetical protein
MGPEQAWSDGDVGEWLPAGLNATVRFRHVAVPFTGRDRGRHALTRGQANLLSVLLDGAAVSLSATLVAPAGTDLARLCTALAELMSRHDSLRTTFELADRPMQVVNGGGELDLWVYQSQTPLDDRALARARDEVRRGGWTDLESTPPLRIAAVCVDSAVSHVLVAICHVLADAAALVLVLEELEALLAGRELAPTGPQPVDLVPLEGQPPLSRRLESSLRYWQAQLRGTAHSLFPPRLTEARPHHPGLLIRSPVAAAAIAQASRRIGISKRTVVLTAVSMVIAQAAGQRMCPVTLPTSNRFLPDMQRYVGQLASDSFACFDLHGVELFDDAARLIARDAIRAYLNGWVDTAEQWSLFDRIALERGIRAHAREYVFNDMSGLGGDSSELRGGPTAGRYRLLGEVSTDDDPWHTGVPLGATMAWLNDEPVVSRLSFDLTSVEPDFGGVLWIDPRSFSAADAVALGAAIEKLLVAAGEENVKLADLASLTGLVPPARGYGWYQVDSGWVELSTARRLLASVVGEDCLVTAVPDGRLGHRLIGFAADSAGTWTPEAVHRACAVALPRLSGTMTPHTYVLCAGAPEDRDDVSAWRGMRVRAIGTGRPAGG